MKLEDILFNIDNNFLFAQEFKALTGRNLKYFNKLTFLQKLIIGSVKINENKKQEFYDYLKTYLQENKQLILSDSDDVGWTVLHYAVIISNTHEISDIIVLLLDHGININAQDMTGDIAVSFSKNPKIINLLMNRGTNMQIKNKYGYCPYDFYIRYHPDLMTTEITNDSTFATKEAECIICAEVLLCNYCNYEHFICNACMMHNKIKNCTVCSNEYKKI